MTSNSKPAAGAGQFRVGGEFAVNRIGYGAMRITGQPGNWGPFRDPDYAHRLLRRAYELGVTFIDTAISYGNGWSEKHIAVALKPFPKDLLVATKCGVVKEGPGKLRRDGRPEWVRESCELSLGYLGAERIDLLQLHAVDPGVPFADTMGAFADLVKAGKVRFVGLSNVTVEQIETARKIVPIASVQNRYSVAERDNDPVLDHCTKHGIAFLPYAPLGANATSGTPFASAEGTLKRIAARHGVSGTQVSLAWLLHRAPNIIPIPGTTSIEHMEQNARAATVKLDAGDMAALNEAADLPATFPPLMKPR